jgi:chromate transport protein ChrA
MRREHDAPTSRTAALRELAALFLRLGLTAFGGPAAHVAMMEDEVWSSAITGSPRRSSSTTGLLALASAAVLLRFRPNSAWLVLAGGVAGLVVSRLR